MSDISKPHCSDCGEPEYACECPRVICPFCGGDEGGSRKLQPGEDPNTEEICYFCEQRLTADDEW